MKPNTATAALLLFGVLTFATIEAKPSNLTGTATPNKTTGSSSLFPSPSSDSSSTNATPPALSSLSTSNDTTDIGQNNDANMTAQLLSNNSSGEETGNETYIPFIGQEIVAVYGHSGNHGGNGTGLLVLDLLIPLVDGIGSDEDTNATSSEDVHNSTDPVTTSTSVLLPTHHKDSNASDALGSPVNALVFA